MKKYISGNLNDQGIKEPDILEPEDKENKKMEERPLNKLLISALGEDPRESKAIKLKVHSNLAGRYAFITTNGLKKEDKELLVSKYQTAELLKAPGLNEQIQTKLNEKALKKDAYRFKSQRLIGIALSVLSSAITMINEEDEESIDQEEFLEKLADNAKLMAEVQFRQSESRRVFIISRFSKSVQELFKKSKQDILMFGKDLTTKIKELKESNKLLKDETSGARFIRNRRSTNRPIHILQDQRDESYPAEGHEQDRGEISTRDRDNSTGETKCKWR